MIRASFAFIMHKKEKSRKDQMRQLPTVLRCRKAKRSSREQSLSCHCFCRSKMKHWNCDTLLTDIHQKHTISFHIYSFFFINTS